MTPVYPVPVQLQLNDDNPLEQTPLFKHGDDKHSSTSVAHVTPVYPVPVQLQLNDDNPLEQAPLFKHGDDKHSSISF